MAKWQWVKVFQESCLLIFLLSGCVTAPGDKIILPQSSVPSTISEKTEATINVRPESTKGLTALVSSVSPPSSIAFVGLRGLEGEKSELANAAFFKLEPILINLCREQGLTMIERDDLQLIMNEWKLEMNGLTKSDQGAQTLLGADIILTGKVKVELPDVHLFLKAINLKDGKILSGAEIRQPAEEYGKAALAEQKAPAPVPAAAVPPPAPITNKSASEDAKIKLWTSANSYNIGDKLTVFFEVSEAAYVSVVDVTPDGETTIIFPNSSQENNYCVPGLTYQIPSAEGDVDLEITGPIGTDRIMAMTSPKPQVAQEAAKSRGVKFTGAIVNTTTSRASIAFDIH